MTYSICSIYDTVDNCHTNLIMARTPERAVRDYVRTVKSNNLQYKDNPLRQINVNEFEVHLLGTFDDETGVITPLDHYKNLPVSFDAE